MSLSSMLRSRRLRRERRGLLRILIVERERWAALSHAELRHRLATVVAYQAGSQGTRYQVEVQLIENSRERVHVMVSADDEKGHLCDCGPSVDFLVFADGRVDK